jgi:hypothetical protein
MQDPARNPDFRATDSYAGKPYYNNFSGFTGLIAISAKDCFPQDIFYFFR